MYIPHNGPEVSADATQLMRQASMTVNEYLGEAIKALDGSFGDGYAESHPELVAAYIRACTADYDSASLAYCLQGIRDSLQSVASAIEEHGQ